MNTTCSETRMTGADSAPRVSHQSSDANERHTDPLTVTVNEASRLLGVGRTKVNELMRAGDLESFMIGRRRLITMESIRRLVARRLADAR